MFYQLGISQRRERLQKPCQNFPRMHLCIYGNWLSLSKSKESCRPGERASMASSNVRAKVCSSSSATPVLLKSPIRMPVSANNERTQTFGTALIQGSCCDMQATPVQNVCVAVLEIKSLVHGTYTHTHTCGVVVRVGSQEDVTLRKVVLARKAAVVGVVSIPDLGVVHPEARATGAHRLQICTTKAWQSLRCIDEAGTHTYIHAGGHTGFRSVQQKHGSHCSA